MASNGIAPPLTGNEATALARRRTGTANNAVICSDTTRSVAVVQGDVITLGINASPGGPNINWTMRFTP